MEGRPRLLIGLDEDSSDCLEFMRVLECVADRALRLRPKRIYIIRIDNWFSSRWYTFRGKYLGGVGLTTEEHRLVVPPFVPSRVVSQLCLCDERGYGEYVMRRTDPLHLKQPARENHQRWIDELSPDSCFIWYSAKSGTHARASIMLYRTTADGDAGWYLELERKEDWVRRRVVGRDPELVDRELLHPLATSLRERCAEEFRAAADTAFEGVKRGRDCLRKAQAWSLYDGYEGDPDPDTVDPDAPWHAVSDAEIESTPDAPFFLDAEAFRFYVPGFMRFSIDHLDSDEYDIAGQTLSQFDSLSMRFDDRRAAFTDDQLDAIELFLQFFLHFGGVENSARAEMALSLLDGWRQRPGESESGDRA
jgi:uncharacterized protein DUF6714